MSLRPFLSFISLFVASAPALLGQSVPEVKTLLKPGVVVERSYRGYAADRAGVRTGDVLLRWRRGNARGKIDSPFDLDEIDTAQKPRGKQITIMGLRGGTRRVWGLDSEYWGMGVRPNFQGALFARYTEAQTLADNGRLHAAVEQWRAMADQINGSDSPWLRCWLLFHAAEALAQAERWDDADRLYQEAVASAPNSGHGIANDLELYWADTSTRRGDWTGAVKILEQLAIDVQQRDKNNPAYWYARRSLHRLVIAYWQGGDLAKAEQYGKLATNLLAQAAPSSFELAIAFDDLGIIGWERGDLAGAEYWYRRGLHLLEILPPRSLLATNLLTNLALTLRDRGELSRAEIYYRRALAIAEKLDPQGLHLAAILNSVGVLEHRRGNLASGESYLRRSLTMEQALSHKDFYSDHRTAETHEDLADVLAERGDFKGAEDEYYQALAIWDRVKPGGTRRAETIAELAGIMRRKQQWDEALKLYEQALNTLDARNARLGGSEEVRSDFRAKHESYYKDYIDLLMAQKQTERAFQVLERSRARGLLEMLAGGHIDVGHGVDSALLERSRSVQQKLTEKSNRRVNLLGQKHSEEQVKVLDKEIADLLLQQQDIEGQIRSSSPAYAALTQPQPLSAQEVQQQLLDQDTLLLEYSLGEERSYLFALTPTAISAYELPGRKSIESAARRVYALLRTGNRGVTGQQAYLQATAELSRMILAPASEELKGKRLLIVSDGALAYVPFALLPAPQASGSGEPVPLIASNEIVNLPSASALALLRQQERGRTQPSKLVAVLADPVFSKGDPRVWGKTLETQRKGVSGGNDGGRSGIPARGKLQANTYDSFESDLSAHLLQRSIDDVDRTGRLVLGRLPFTRQEAQAITAAVPADQGFQALDFQASRGTATGADMAQYRIVHFATHGLLDSRHPELSGLVLSLVDKHGRPQNGFLDLQDVYNLHLSADLVVLSACETGLGKEVDGEGLVGLTRGFMYAGAARVMASLWRVDDEATAQLMAKFYDAVLKEDKSPTEAMRQAQLWMRAQPRWREPYYWAGFVLQGEWK